MRLRTPVIVWLLAGSGCSGAQKSESCACQQKPEPEPEPEATVGTDWAERRHALVQEHRRLLPTENDDWKQFEELRRAWCLKQVKAPPTKPLETCGLEELGSGSVLLLTLVTECGGDSCSTEGYVANADLTEFVRVPHDTGGGAEASPTGDALFVSALTDAALPSADEHTRDPFGGNDPVILNRIGLPSMKAEPFAPCFSPKLSPKGHWILCRDLGANVLKVPLSGGEPSLVTSSNLQPGEVAYVWYAYIWPDAVAFVSETRFKFTIAQNGSDTVMEREVEWQE
jgi:hypothetical protein